MAQYKIGTVSVTNGSQVVTGSGTLWLANLAAGALFTIPNDNITYEIASVDSDTQVTLNANYVGDTNSGLTYAMHRDFTSGNIPLLSNNDIETGTIFSRAMAQVQDLINSIVTSIVDNGTATKLTIEDTEITASVPLHDQDGNVRTGSNGIYNGKMTISQRGDYTIATAFTNDYFLDRWRAIAASVTATIQQVLISQPSGVNGNSMKVAATSSATGNMGAEHRIENYGFYAGKTVTISAYVKSNTSNSRLYIDDDGVATLLGSHTGGGGWELLSGTIALTGLTNLTLFARVLTAGLGNVSITTGDYIELTDVRLDLGSHRLSGDREHAEELALCQRYYWQGYLANRGICYMYGVTGVPFYVGDITFPVVMRASPTVGIVTAPTYNNCTNSDVLAREDGLSHRVNVTTNGTYRAADGIYSASAEL